MQRDHQSLARQGYDIAQATLRSLARYATATNEVSRKPSEVVTFLKIYRPGAIVVSILILLAVRPLYPPLNHVVVQFRNGSSLY